MAEVIRILEKVDMPEIYEDITLSCKEGSYAILYSPNCILLEPLYYQYARNFFEQQKIQSLLSKENRSYYRGLLRFDLSEASNRKLEILRNLNITSPTSKLSKPKDDVFEDYANRNNSGVTTEECRCRMPESVKQILNKVKNSKKRKWRRFK